MRLEFPPRSAENRLYSPYLMSNLLSTLKGSFRTKITTIALAYAQMIEDPRVAISRFRVSPYPG